LLTELISGARVKSWPPVAESDEERDELRVRRTDLDPPDGPPRGIRVRKGVPSAATGGRRRVFRRMSLYTPLSIRYVASTWRRMFSSAAANVTFRRLTVTVPWTSDEIEYDHADGAEERAKRLPDVRLLVLHRRNNLSAGSSGRARRTPSPP
jgi:hypothetical protein